MFKKSSKSFFYNNVKLVYSYIPWDSEYLGNSTYEILEIQGNINQEKDVFSKFEELLKCKVGDLFYIKIPTGNNSLIVGLNSVGFYFIEQSVETKINLTNWDRQRFNKRLLDISKAADEEIEEIANIAGKTFREDRYHKDPNIAPEKADFRFKKWIENSYKLGEEIYAVKNNGSIVGFFVLVYKDNVAQIRLNGISPEYQGQGLGISSYLSILAMLQENGVSTVLSNISLNNLRVFNIYAYLGFQFLNPQVVLHKVIL